MFDRKENKKIKLGLIGHPIGHSFSKIIHTKAIEVSGLQGSYELLETKPENLIERIKFLKQEDYSGFNVTIPYKVPITLFLSNVDEYANIAKCANTVKILEDKSMIGYNTDIYGFMASLENKIQIKNESAALFGLGGAARAVVASLYLMGAKKIDIYVRNIINASDTIKDLRNEYKNLELNLIQLQNIKSLSEYKIIINATPIGMRGHSADISIIGVDILKTFNSEGLVYDLIYNPIETIFLKYAKNLGFKTVNGLDMLIYQGKKAFEIWTNKNVDFNILKIAVLEQFILNN